METAPDYSQFIWLSDTVTIYDLGSFEQGGHCLQDSQTNPSIL